MILHIGKMIEDRLEAVGMSKAEFGRRIDTSRQNVNTLLRKEDMSVELLRKIGKVLHMNFLAVLSEDGRDGIESNQAGVGGGRPFATVTLELWSVEEYQSFMAWRKTLE